MRKNIYSSHYDALLPSRWPFPPPPSTWCAPWPPCHAPSTWCAPWPPCQAPPPSHPWCPPWTVSRKKREKCARKRKKIGGGSCPPGKYMVFGGVKCPHLGSANVRILGVINVFLENETQSFLLLPTANYWPNSRIQSHPDSLKWMFDNPNQV